MARGNVGLIFYSQAARSLTSDYAWCAWVPDLSVVPRVLLKTGRKIMARAPLPPARVRGAVFDSLPPFRMDRVGLVGHLLSSFRQAWIGSS